MQAKHATRGILARRSASTAANSRSGAALVEFAIIVPLFFSLIFGIIEFSRAMMVQQILTNASREGAREAVVEGATVTQVQSTVSTYLANASVNSSTVTCSPTALGALGFGDPVTVSVSVPYQSVSWIGSPWFLDGVTLQASTVMRAERLQ